MTIEQDRAFYARRLTEERARAAAAGDANLSRLHLQWAALYAARLAAIAPAPDPAPDPAALPEKAA